MINETLIPIIGILVTTLVAIYSIRKIAETNRVSNIHLEMTSCLISTISILDRAISLLDDISRHVVYYRVPEQKIIETAYDRYWREIKDLSDKFKKIQSKQKLVFPSELYNNIQDLLKAINNARELVKHVSPDENNLYPDTQELQKEIEIVASKYKNFINRARCYLGTDEISPISKLREEILKANDDEKISKKV